MTHRNHVIDGAFALALFGIFAVCAMLLILLGARVYEKVSSNMNKMDAPVILSYVTEKLRSCNDVSEVALEADGHQLILKEDTLNGDYETWIYVEDGCLKEALIQEGREPIANAGNVIAPVQEFLVNMTTQKMLMIQVKDAEGNLQIRYFNLTGKNAGVFASERGRRI